MNAEEIKGIITIIICIVFLLSFVSNRFTDVLLWVVENIIFPVLMAIMFLISVVYGISLVVN